MKRLAIIALLSLAGCTHTRLVSVPCVDPASIPAEPPKVAPQLTGDARADVATLAISALQLRQYALELRALLTGCIG